MARWAEMLVLVCVLSAYTAVQAQVPRDELSASQARGKLLYETGKSASGGTVTAQISPELSVPAADHPCIRCHLENGTGGLEGGVTIPDITWHRLTAAHGTLDAYGKLRSAYDQTTLISAIRKGTDASGKPLDPIMPRYRLSDADVADLIDYLRVLGREREPGTTADTIRVCSLLPLGSPHGRSTAELLNRYFAQINEAGGIYGRRLEFVTADPGMSLVQARSAAASLPAGGDSCFFFVANAGAGASPEAIEELTARGIPVVGPLTFVDYASQEVFQVLPVIEDQARAAARWLSEAGMRADGVAVFVGTGAAAQAMARGFLDEAGFGHISAVAISEGVDGLEAALARLGDEGPRDVVVFASAEEAAPVVHAAMTSGVAPRLTFSGVLQATHTVAYDGVVVRILPTLAPDSADPAVRSLSELAATADMGGDRLGAMHLAAFAAARIAVRALTEVGVRPTRRAFVQALEELRDFDTGVTPPIRFAPGRRLGIRGALLSVSGDAGATDEDGGAVSSHWVGW